jgi:hypothetical protein
MVIPNFGNEGDLSSQPLCRNGLIRPFSPEEDTEALGQYRLPGLMESWNG